MSSFYLRLAFVYFSISISKASFKNYYPSRVSTSHFRNSRPMVQFCFSGSKMLSFYFRHTLMSFLFFPIPGIHLIIITGAYFQLAFSKFTSRGSILLLRFGNVILFSEFSFNSILLFTIPYGLIIALLMHNPKQNDKWVHSFPLSFQLLFVTTCKCLTHNDVVS
jgi:hypothetical protein